MIVHKVLNTFFKKYHASYIKRFMWETVTCSRFPTRVELLTFVDITTLMVYMYTMFMGPLGMRLTFTLEILPVVLFQR